MLTNICRPILLGQLILLAVLPLSSLAMGNARDVEISEEYWRHTVYLEMEIRFPGGGGDFFGCNGLLIGSRGILTAAHCFVPLHKNGDRVTAIKLTKFKGSSISETLYFDALTNDYLISILPQYLHGGPEDGNATDLAVIVFNKPITDAEHQAAEFPQANFAAQVGASLEIVSGRPGKSGSLKADPILQVAGVKFKNRQPDPLGGHSIDVDSKAFICPGDSGASLFIDEGGVPVAYAILSASDRSSETKCSSNQARNYSAVLIPYLGWILNTYGDLVAQLPLTQ